MIRLYINYIEIETPQNTDNILANFSINDISGVGQRRGAVTQTIELPATPVNQSALLNLPAVGSPAYIESNGVSVFSGRARVAEIKRNISGISSIVITLYGDNLEFAYLLSDRQVRDVVTENFTHDRTTVENGVSGKVLFPLINYGALDTVNEVAMTEMRPAINVAYILEKILNGIGYKLSSTFWGTPDAAKLYTLFTCGPYLCDSAYKNTFEFRAELTTTQSGTYTGGGLGLFFFDQLLFDDDFTPPNFDVNNIYDTGTFLFTPAATTEYKITSRLLTTSVARPILFVVEVSGGGAVLPFIFPNPISDNGSEIYFESEWVTLDAGSTYYIGIAGGNGVAYSIDPDSWFALERRPEVLEGDDVNISDCLPTDTTQLNFIKGLVHMFNQYFYADVNRKIFYCEPRNNYAASAGLTAGFYNTTIIDINELVSVGSETTVKIYDNLGEVVRFQHNEGDNYVGQIENGTNEVLYSATWGMETQAKQNVTVSENPTFGRFSLIADQQTAETETAPNGGTFTPAIVMPRLWNADWDGVLPYPTKHYEYQTMLALIEEGVNITGGWKMTYNGGFAVYSKYNYAYMFDFPALSTQVLSLSFGNEVNVLGSTTAGLLQRFYLREQVSKRGGQVIELKMVVSAWLINYLHSIQYKAFFQYRGDLYTIQEIKNYVIGGTEICNVSLLLERFADATDVSLIENSGLNCLNNVS